MKGIINAWTLDARVPEQEVEGDLLQQRRPLVGPREPSRVSRPLHFLPKGAKIKGWMVAAMSVISRVISAYAQYRENRLNLAGTGHRNGLAVDTSALVPGGERVGAFPPQWSLRTSGARTWQG